VYERSLHTWAESSSTHDESRLTITEDCRGDVTVLTLAGEMLLDDGELAFRSRVNKLLAHGRTKVVVDLGRVTHIDSSGVGMLIAKLQRLRKFGGDLRLSHLTPRYQRLLATMRVLSLFQVFDDETSAVFSFSEPPVPVH